MKMNEIYVALEIEKKSAEVIYEALEKGKAEIEEKILKLQEELEDITPRWKTAKDNVTSIAMAMESLAAGNFSLSAEEKKVEEAFIKEEASSEEEKQLVWKHKNAVLVKYGRDGTRLGTYTSQRKLAAQLGISQPTVGTYIKMPKEAQIEKNGYYLVYEH